jgi:Beta-1,3-glucanase
MIRLPFVRIGTACLVSSFVFAAASMRCGSSDSTNGAAGSSGTGPVVPLAGGACPDDFWGDTTTIPTATNVMTFKFINRSNPPVPDRNVYWSFKSGTIDELHSIAEQNTYDMPANSSGRMYFYVVSDPPDPAGSDANPRNSKYYDFIEHTIGATQYNGNTTRVDRWGLKIAMRMHCADGYDIAVGEDCGIFAMTRQRVFDTFVAEVPTEFKGHGTINAPYGIPEMGGIPDFKSGGKYWTYMDSWQQELWSSNGIGGVDAVHNCNPIAEPSLSAACYRHVGAGELTAAGGLKQGSTLWGNASTPSDHDKFYPTGPANYYAKFWHDHGLLKRAYGFPYDDVGGWSSYISHANPQWIIVAIGF